MQISFFTVKPPKVKILTPNNLLTAGQPMPLRCEAVGSYPPAKIIWLLDGEPIRSADITVDTNVIQKALQFSKSI